MKVVLCVCAVLLLGTAEGKRSWGGGGRRGGFGSSSKHRVPSPPPPPPSHSGGHHSGGFLDAERAGSGTTHNRGNPFGNPAPPGPTHTNGPIGFEKLGGNQGGQGHQIGFDKVNSQKPNYNPSAPPGPVGPPPAYPGGHSPSFGGNDHPPPYPGRPVNAPPAYTPNQHYPGQQQYPHQNQYGNPSYGGSPGYGSPYPGNFPAGGAGYGGGGGFGGYHSNGYQGNAYGGSPFGGYQGNTYGGIPFGGGGGGYSGNPYYSPNNFGYSNNPGYFGGGNQYGQRRSGFGLGGLPIPIPIPIPIGGFGGFGGGYGGGYGHSSYNHRVLHTFVSSSNTSTSGNSSTSVFLLNNSTVAPCTTDHFVYDNVKVTTLACTVEACTAVKVQTRTNVSRVETVHGGAVTLCWEGANATVSSEGEIVAPTVSEIRTEALTVCRNVSSNATTTNATEATTTAPETTTIDLTTTTTTTAATTTTTTTATPVNTTVCEKVNCSSVEMCLPAVEIVDPCSKEPCPFRRTGYKPCVVVKMCRAPSAPVSTFATLNTTIFKVDEFQKHRETFDAANLTLISYHPPRVPVFNTTNSTIT